MSMQISAGNIQRITGDSLERPLAVGDPTVLLDYQIHFINYYLFSLCI